MGRGWGEDGARRVGVWGRLGVIYKLLASRLCSCICVLFLLSLLLCLSVSLSLSLSDRNDFLQQGSTKLAGQRLVRERVDG